MQTMKFGLGWPQEVNDQTIRDLLNNRCYWSGEVLYDYAFHIANKHMFLGVLFSHPAHPYSKLERLYGLTLICLLIVFPVSALTIGLPLEAHERALVIWVMVTLPR